MSYQTEIITSQPQVTVTSFTVSSGSTDWSSGVCDCCDDCGICLCGTFIPCALGCKVAQDHDETCCLPFLPGAMVALRTSIRDKYQINGTLCDDWLIMSCLGPCGLCQMAREQKMRG
ncbi:cornifelin homolog [Triplophysa dalaica]|uniref:cornifelin homolog n=1 Tax=Triplophysa dalaica TaxID=1582913 RepID=UPI0024E00EAA|nr:cornifelin homolog [Triplophysa dalaica]